MSLPWGRFDGAAEAAAITETVSDIVEAAKAFVRKKVMLVADLFCGAGGTSKGAKAALTALGLTMILVAVNHWPIACRTHVWTTEADDEADPIVRAWQFLIASWMAFGGCQMPRSAWRLDKTGRSSLARTWDSIPQRLVTVAQRLKRCQIL